MKICHSIKFTPQEKIAIETVQCILHEMSIDDMICTDFEQTTHSNLNKIDDQFNVVIQYLADFGFGE